jgi:hypothetical protein
MSQTPRLPEGRQASIKVRRACLLVRALGAIEVQFASYQVARFRE